VWNVEFSEDAEHDFELIFDHLVDSYMGFGEDIEDALEHAADRLRGIRGSSQKLGLTPQRGTLRDDISPGIRFVRLEKAVLWFDLDEQRQVVRVLAVFFGAQDHIRHMLTRVLATSS
jgi:plasmid stabilization system protein ParE